jgi:hypothetical protein
LADSGLIRAMRAIEISKMESFHHRR